MAATAQETMSNVRSAKSGRDLLGVQQDFELTLFLDLQYLNTDFESMDSADVQHFCDSCVSQLTSPIVRASASAYNATIVSVGIIEEGGLRCIERTVKEYDPEAEDIFGPGYFSLHVQLSFSIVLASNNHLWLELVQSIAGIGFERISGGADDLLRNLQTNEAFESKSSTQTELTF